MSEDSAIPSELPIAVARALRQAEAHPSVRSVSVTGRTVDWTLCQVVIHTELPAVWRAVGQSPFGVQIDEAVTIALHDRFPLVSPWIRLRDDFPRIHPHIQPGKAGSLVEPCLVLGSPREVVQARGFVGLIEQLVEWLDRAAELDLNDPEHGWEPVRRDTISDIIACDADRMRSHVTLASGTALFTTTYIHYPKSDMFRVLLGSNCILPPALIGPILRRDGDIGSGLTLLAWPGSGPQGPIIADFYLPETVATVGDLFERADLYSCREDLLAGLVAVRDGLIANPPPQAIPLAILLLPRRPYPLVGSDSTIEICPYLIEVVPGQDFLDTATPVRLAGQRETINAGLLRRTSGDDPFAATLPWTILGAGSVGSKIALHAARAGRAPSIVVDRGHMNAHNYARHTAMPIGTTERLFLRAKADLVVDQINKLDQKATAVSDDAVSLIGSTEGRAQLAHEGCAMLVDTTASLVTREALAHAPWPDRPRIVEACLLGAGRMAYVACEGPDANPSISDLAAEAYRELALDVNDAAIAFGARAEEVIIGQGCSAVTFPMPDSDLSMLAASMARPITGWARDGLPTRGEIRIGRTDADGGLAWSVANEDAWIDVDRLAPDEPGIRIHPRVHAAIEADIALNPGVETGGVLVGRFSQIGNLFQVVDLIAAPPDSTRSAAEFVLGKQGLRAAVLDIARRTGGALQVIGTWHNHLITSGPSMTDAIAGGILAMRQFGPALLLIHTPGGYAKLIAEQVYSQPAMEVGEGEEP